MFETSKDGKAVNATKEIGSESRGRRYDTELTRYVLEVEWYVV